MSIHLEGAAALFFVVAIALIVILVISLPAFISIFVVLAMRKKASRHVRENRSTIIAQYEAPRGFSPAALGYMYEGKMSRSELIATVVDIRSRGDSNVENLLPHEKAALAYINKGRVERTIPTLVYSYNDDNTVASVSQRDVSIPIMGKGLINSEFKRLVYGDLKQQGYMSKGMLWSTIKNTLIFTVITNITMIVFGFFFGMDFGTAFLLVLVMSYTWPLFMAIGLIYSLIMRKILGGYFFGTKKLHKLWPEIEGYREFLKQTEKSRAEFEIKNGTVKYTRELADMVALGLIDTDLIRLK